jgi:hypothetical protein
MSMYVRVYDMCTYVCLLRAIHVKQVLLSQSARAIRMLTRVCVLVHVRERVCIIVYA